jgi:2-dehydro-3-deoxyphosphogluconate aldolase/(4S)-4-hydroxy-2-oxoglutarate aldolase
MTNAETSGPLDGSDATGVEPAAATMQRLADAGVIAVIRAPDVDAAVRAVDAMVRGGVTGVEITYSTPDVPAVLHRLQRSYGEDIVLGVGTVTDVNQVDVAVSAGARFLVAPGLDDAVAAAMADSGLATLAGAFTPTEVMRARAAGAHGIKLFPASTGGVEHLRALLGPFPGLRFVPTGGVSAANLRAWLAAGAFAVGAAGSLCPPSAMSTGDFDEIHRRATALAAAIREHRADAAAARGRA